MFNHTGNIKIKMLMEGVEIPLNSISVVCTPNGVEAQIGVNSTTELYNLKPKTAVQVFYKDWVVGDNSWRLLFDGFISATMKGDTDTGVNASLVCRDFRMDMRKMPAAMAWEPKQHQLGVKHLYSSAGIFHNWTVKGSKGKGGGKTRTYGETGLNDVSEMIRYISGTAKGGGAKKKKGGEYTYTSGFGGAVKKDPKGYADCGLFLDSVIRGIWTESEGGTSMGYLINKRLRVDKRMVAPVNKSGYDFWKKANAGIQLGSYLMGNSIFSSVEAAIMRLAGLFSVRVFSCSTPTLIPIGEDTDATSWIISKNVRDFLVNRKSNEFGGKYLINETMLLPPLDFTAPPNCNVFLPPMCQQIQWTYDRDVDATRGVFKKIDSLSTPGSNGSFATESFQMPTALFGISGKKKGIGSTNKLLTLDERYSGVKVVQGSVEYNLAADDVSKLPFDKILKASARADIKEKIANLTNDVGAVAAKKESAPPAVSSVLAKQQLLLKKLIKEYKKSLNKVSAGQKDAVSKNTNNALQRHAALKFLNRKYTGRVATISMSFNPYVMCGFPGAVIASPNSFGDNVDTTIVGMVQQVTHNIVKSIHGGSATTTVIMNGARFIDEPTDIDPKGDALYMKKTDPKEAEINQDTLKYTGKQYFVPPPLPRISHGSNNSAYDLSKSVAVDGYIYSKDLLTLTSKDVVNGKVNNIYLDSIYEPNRIAKFYRDVLQHKEDSFMIGKATITKGLVPKAIKFMYDTIHEGLDVVRKNKLLMTDYKSAMVFARRDVCNADAFFQGILGLSVRNSDGSYTNQESNFDITRIDSEYFGVTTAKWKSGDVDKLKFNPDNVDKSGLMEGPGEFSSILETTPVTAFIQERKDEVLKYKTKLENRILSEGYNA